MSILACNTVNDAHLQHELYWGQYLSFLLRTPEVLVKIGKRSGVSNIKLMKIQRKSILSPCNLVVRVKDGLFHHHE